jgi:RNA polymerase sigma-70 factor, ECF subfamily
VTATQQQNIFEDWLSKHRSVLFKVVRAYAKTPMDRDDLFQEICIQVWKSIPSFRAESSVVTWIYRIALNTALRFSERSEKHVSAHLENIEHLLQDAPIEHDARLDWLYAEIANFDPIDRSVILLMLDDFSYREMSAILGITESNVGVKINRLKKQLISKSKKIQPHGI